MAVKEVTPFIMRNAIVQLGTDDFAKAVSSATITPSGGIVTWKGLKPTAVYSFAEAITYTLDLEYSQDWGTAGSLSQYLWQHKGENIAATVNVNDALSGGETTWAMTVMVTAGAVGGAVDGVAVATVSLGIVGEPVPTFPTTAAE